VSHYYHAQTIDTLRLIGDHASVGTRELAELLGKTRDVVKNKIDNLHNKGLIDSHREGRGGKAGYFITPKGKRLLEKMDEPQAMGEFPAARTPASRQPYVPAPIVTRPGALDFLACPSRRGDELKPHSLPISLAGGGA
jgi:DNA-binding MarR family transcriptional regulator